MKICLDAGHYGNYNAGVIAGYYEAKCMWKITNYQKQFLEEYENVTVILTRQDQTKDLALYNRGQKAKGCDLFISNHSNACGTESVDYPVVYRAFDNKGNADVLALKLAKVIASVMGTKQSGRTATRKGTSGSEYYGVLRGARVAGLSHYYIVEHSFHTNKKACNFLLNEENIKRLAKAEVEAIAGYYGLKKKGNTKEEAGNTSLPYVVRVTCDELNVRKGAGTSYAVTTQVKKGQAFTIVEVKNGWGKLKSGAGWISLAYTQKI